MGKGCSPLPLCSVHPRKHSTARAQGQSEGRPLFHFSLFPFLLHGYFCRTNPASFSPRYLGVVDECTAVVAIACAGSLGVCLCSVLQVVRRVPLFPFSIPSHPSFKWVGWPWFVSTVVGEEMEYLPLLWISAGATCPVVNFSPPVDDDDTTNTKTEKLPPRLPESRVPYRTSQIAS